MDSNKIKSLAFGARDKLRAEVAARIEAVLAEGSPERLDQGDKVKRLEDAVADRGLDAVIESSAYTWFNRLCALRFMDARGYTPVPAVTPREGATQPAMLTDAIRGAFDPDWGFSRLVRDRVQNVLAGTSAGGSNRTEAAYSELLLAACDHYAEAMPYLFGEAAASSLAMPRGLLAEDSILRRIVSEMDDKTCESVEVLGWLYQFYVAERKDEFNAGDRKATADDIAPATQLFTPNWIVRYLVENSLGRLWMLNNQGSALADKMDYYIAPEGEAEDFIKVQSPEELTLCDPACGSGHILAYAFDLLYEIYLEEGYFPENIPALILEKNLFGMEIDARAAEIAKFALEMKAREKDPGFFERHIDVNVTVLEEVRLTPEELADAGLLRGATRLLEAFAHMKEVGSLYVPDPGDVVLVDDAIRNTEGAWGLLEAKTLEKLRTMRGVLEALSRRFDCVVANPPYLGSGHFNGFVSAWTKKYYPDEKSDLCTCFIRRGFSLAKVNGYSSMVTMHSWLTQRTYKTMRRFLVEAKDIVALIDLGAGAFEQIAGDVVQVCATVMLNGYERHTGRYIDLQEFKSSSDKKDALVSALDSASQSYAYLKSLNDFANLPDCTISYGLTPAMCRAFAGNMLLGDCAPGSVGIQTGNNALFIKVWWEVAYSNIGFGLTSISDLVDAPQTWYPLNKGGDYRKWYGNDYEVINWKNDGEAVKHLLPEEKRHVQDYKAEYKFSEVVTWSKIGGGAFRFKPKGFLSDMAGIGIYPQRHAKAILGLLNSSVGAAFLKKISPTITKSVGEVRKVPLNDKVLNDAFDSLVERLIAISHTDWDAFEISWHFEFHPLAPSARERAAQFSFGLNSDARRASVSLISERFKHWSNECDYRFSQLKENEEELNRIFARIYGMEGEVPIEVPDDKVSVRRADLGRDVRSLVSYGVGCIMGRYSVYAPGLILADAGQMLADFDAKVPDAAFRPDADAILPVLDDEWFADDIVAQFTKWLKLTYGKDTLDENVAFIEDTLGKDLRKYFVKDFYKDHCATYQVSGSGKRPIYWMFSSPKGGFQALVYMHRYTPSTVGQILTKYLREYIEKLGAATGALDQSDRAADKRQADRYRAVVKELTDWERDVVYPLANERVAIDLDDGVKKNYNKFPHALAKVAGLSEWK